MVKLPSIIMFPKGQPPRNIKQQPLRIATELSRNANLCHFHEGIEIMGGKEYFKRSEIVVLPHLT